MDVAEAVAAAAEGERDPRCLLRIFACVRAAAALYSGSPPSPARSPATEALFDSLAWYFPMSFTPPTVNKVCGFCTPHHNVTLPVAHHSSLVFRLLRQSGAAGTAMHDKRSQNQGELGITR